MWEGKIGCSSSIKHHMSLIRQAPLISSDPQISIQPYRAVPQSGFLIEAEGQRLLDMEVIQLSSGPRSAPVVLVPKTNGSIRFCINNRKLNSLAKNDSYDLPRIDHYLDSLRTAHYFSALDKKCGYWQIEVEEEDREKTYFTSPKRLYHF